MKEASIKQLVAAGISVILAWVYIMAGWRKIFPSDEVEIRFMEYGYDAEFAVQVGIAELCAGVFVLIPRVSTLGGVMIVALGIGAIYTHLSTSVGSPLLAIVMLVLAIILTVLRWPDFFLVRLTRSKN